MEARLLVCRLFQVDLQGRSDCIDRHDCNWIIEMYRSVGMIECTKLNGF